jgi:hypothetical protein
MFVVVAAASGSNDNARGGPHCLTKRAKAGHKAWKVWKKHCNILQLHRSVITNPLSTPRITVNTSRILLTATVSARSLAAKVTQFLPAYAYRLPLPYYYPAATASATTPR